MKTFVCCGVPADSVEFSNFRFFVSCCACSKAAEAKEINTDPIGPYPKNRKPSWCTTHSCKRTHCRGISMLLASTPKRQTPYGAPANGCGARPFKILELPIYDPTGVEPYVSPGSDCRWRVRGVQCALEQPQGGFGDHPLGNIRQQWKRRGPSSKCRSNASVRSFERHEKL